MSVIFNELRIRRMKYGPNEGKIVAELDVEGATAKTIMIIPEPDSLKILQLCAAITAQAGAKQALAFHNELMEAMNSLEVRA